MKFRLPRSRFRRAVLYVMSAILVLLAIDLAWVRLWRRITIGPQTTVISSPLKADGTPDYFQYIDDRARQGVTAENNAFIPYLNAVSPLKLDAATRNEVAMDDYYRRLGMPVPIAPHKIISFPEYLESLSATVGSSEGSDEEALSWTQPWSAADHPRLAAWLAANERPLSFLPAITARSRWYPPLARSSNDMLISVLLPYISAERQLANLAMARAMLRIQSGQFHDAATDILAVHRFARLIAQGWTAIEYLVALAIDRMALQADVVFASAPGLSAAERAEFYDGLSALTPWRSEVPLNFEAERLCSLDTIAWLSRNPQKVQMLMGVTERSPQSLNAVSMALRPAHFNAAMRDINGFFDQFAAACRTTNIVEREKKVAENDAAMAAYARAHEGILGDPAKQICSILLPSWATFVRRHDSHEVAARLTSVALALCDHRARKGEFPATLADLNPSGMPVLDSYNPGGTFQYKKTPEGFLLYSFGPDLADDGGKELEGGNSHYDIVFQVPRSKPASGRK